MNRLGDDLEGLEAALVLSPREWDRDSEPRCDDTSPWWTSDVAGKSWLRALPQFGGALRVGLVGLGLVPLLLGVLLCFFPDCLHRVRSGWGR